jgi:hypothetical protein
VNHLQSRRAFVGRPQNISRPLRVCAKTSAGQEAHFEQNDPHPDPLPSDGRGNNQPRLSQLPKRLDTPPTEHDSPSPIRWERAGVRVSVPQNPKLFLHESLCRLVIWIANGRCERQKPLDRDENQPREKSSDGTEALPSAAKPHPKQLPPPRNGGERAGEEPASQQRYPMNPLESSWTIVCCICNMNLSKGIRGLLRVWKICASFENFSAL